MIEIGHLLLSALPRRRIDDAKRCELVAVASASRSRIDREPVAMGDVDALAARHDPSACDAVHLGPAERRSLLLATLDACLAAATAAEDVSPARFGATAVDDDARPVGHAVGAQHRRGRTVETVAAARRLPSSSVRLTCRSPAR